MRATDSHHLEGGRISTLFQQHLIIGDLIINIPQYCELKRRD